MKLTLIIIIPFLFISTALFSQNYTADVEQFFASVKDNRMNDAARLVEKLSKIDQEKLKKHLDTENKAKAFWLNIYNTFAQYLLKNKPDLYKERNDFFSDELITVAGQKLSLDDIEHGIIRRSKNKYSMGYVGKLSVGDFEEKFRLAKTDYRIHFALNCGAKSCPPVALYVADKIDDQLDKSTSKYLKANTRFEEKEDEIHVPKLCSWFKADFGGEDGVIEMLHKFEILPKDKNPDIKYLDYNWELSLSNYIDL